MTIQEAIYCMKSYLPEAEDEYTCFKCPYHGANKIDDQIYVCNSSEAHRMAIQALELKLEKDLKRLKKMLKQK